MEKSRTVKKTRFIPPLKHQLLPHFKGGDNRVFFHSSFVVELWFMYFSNDQSLKFQEKKDKPVGKRAHSEKNTIYLPFKKSMIILNFKGGDNRVFLIVLS